MPVSTHGGGAATSVLVRTFSGVHVSRMVGWPQALLQRLRLQLPVVPLVQELPAAAAGTAVVGTALQLLQLLQALQPLQMVRACSRAH
jgi:hypothetical protein